MSEYVFVFFLHAPSEEFPLTLTFRQIPTIEQIIEGIRGSCCQLDIAVVGPVMRAELPAGMLAVAESVLLERAANLAFQGVHVRRPDGLTFGFQRVPLR